MDPSNTVGRVEGRGVGGVRQDGRVSEIPETDESTEQVQPETPADVPDELRGEAEATLPELLARLSPVDLVIGPDGADALTLRQLRLLAQAHRNI